MADTTTAAETTPAQTTTTTETPQPPAPAGAAPPAPPAAATPPAEPPKPVVSPQLAELNRKEWAFRQEKKKFDDERKARAAEDSERATREEQFRTDPQALIEHYGYTIDGFIDLLAKGGADSPEGRVRALELKIQRKEQEEKSAEEKRKEQADKATKAEMRAQATRFVHGEVAKLVTEDRFELCAGTDGIANEVVKYIRMKWDGVPEIDQFGNETGRMIGGGEDVTVEQALEALESVLDARATKYAQSKKLKAKLAPEQAEPEASRQSPSVPTATKQRTITIKNRTQAVAPIRKPTEGRASRDEITRQVAANLGRLFGGN
jgi:hypothetical protein